jgi:hypothetical protein
MDPILFRLSLFITPYISLRTASTSGSNQRTSTAIRACDGHGERCQDRDNGNSGSGKELIPFSGGRLIFLASGKSTGISQGAESFYKPRPHRSRPQTSATHIHVASPPFKWPCCHREHACSHVQGISPWPCFVKDFRPYSVCAWQHSRRKTRSRARA